MINPLNQLIEITLNAAEFNSSNVSKSWKHVTVITTNLMRLLWSIISNVPALFFFFAEASDDVRLSASGQTGNMASRFMTPATYFKATPHNADLLTVTEGVAVYHSEHG